MAWPAVNVLLIILFAVTGAGVGAVHFRALQSDVILLTHVGSALTILALRLGRMALTIAMLVAAARQGWPVLLGATAGFLAARQLVMRRLIAS